MVGRDRSSSWVWYRGSRLILSWSGLLSSVSVLASALLFLSVFFLHEVLFCSRKWRVRRPCRVRCCLFHICLRGRSGWKVWLVLILLRCQSFPLLRQTYHHCLFSPCKVFDLFFIMISVSMWKWFYHIVIIFFFTWSIDVIKSIVTTQHTHQGLIMSTFIKIYNNSLSDNWTTSVRQFRPKLSKYSITSGLIFIATQWVPGLIWSSRSTT